MVETTGRALAATDSPAGWLVAESRTGGPALDGLARVDGMLARLMTASLRGSLKLSVTQERHVEPTARLVALSDEHRAFVDDQYGLDRQRARGAWYVPDEVKVAVGLCRLTEALYRDGEYALVTVAEDTITVPTAAQPDHVMLWSALLPFVERVLAPVVLRSGLPGIPKPEGQQAAWAATEAYYAAVGLDGGPAYEAMCWGNGWGRLTRADHGDARQELVEHLAPQMTADLLARHRAVVLAELSEAVYAKSKKDLPLARRVLTKRLQPALSAYFAGDWLAFLDYLGEQPNPSEEVFTALPQPRLYVNGNDRVEDIAAEQGLDAARVAEVLASFSGQSTAVTPVEERIRVMRAWWTVYDEVHARQVPGRSALWGLLGDGGIRLSVHDETEGQPIPRLYARLFPPGLVADVDRLWGRTTLPRWPERLVLQPHPHLAFSNALGPALKLWDGIALTTWYLTEGPASRTTLDELEEYHARDLTALESTGFPVDRRLFADLRDAQRHLGPEEEVQSLNGRRVGVITGASSRREPDAFVTVGMTRTRRDGFERLRDIVTTHRRVWARNHLDAYLRSCWERPLTDLSESQHQALAARGKPMTAKQFATKAAPIANAWFGGRLDLVYAAIGEKAIQAQVDVGPDLPTTIQELSRYVFHLLGGDEAADRFQQDWLLRNLASKTGKYVQFSAARGEPPEPKDLNVGGAGTDEEVRLTELWPRYREAVQEALASSRSTIEQALGAVTPQVPPSPSDAPRSNHAQPPRPLEPASTDVAAATGKPPGFMKRLFGSRL